MTDVRRPLSLQLCVGNRAEDSASSNLETLNNRPQLRHQPTSTSSTNSTSSLSSSSSSLSGGCGSPDTPSLILPYLYVGDQDQTQIETLSSLNISYILSLQSLPKFLDSNLTSATQQVKSKQADYCRQQQQQRQQPNNSKKIKSYHDEDQNLTNYSNYSGEAKKKRSNNIQSTKDTNLTGAPRTTPTSMPTIITQDTPDTLSKTTTNCDNDEVVEVEEAQNCDIICNDNDDQSTSTHGTSKKIDPKGLLPSVNSSKDYLVKFRSCVNKLIRGKCINISDTFEQLVDKFFDETHSFIEEARRNKCNILVHCKAGISRSPTIAIAYLMKWKRLHLQDAYDFVKRCRPQISPNLNFMGQLMSYERKLLQRNDGQLYGPWSLPSPSLCHLPGPSSLSMSQSNDDLTNTD